MPGMNNSIEAFTTQQEKLSDKYKSSCLEIDVSLIEGRNISKAENVQSQMRRQINNKV